MNSSAFMDKQITALSGSDGGGGDFFDLLNPQEERHQSSSNGGGIGGDEILASYDFQPIRGNGSPSPPAVTGLDSRARQSRSSDESQSGSSSLKFTCITESHEVTKVSHEKERDAYDVAKMAEIDHTVKKHTDSLLLALEGVSSRLSQIESRTRHLETYVGELKVSVETANGSTDGKLRQLENILREVQTGVQVLRDKQEISETRPQLAKLQASEEHPPPKQSHTAKLDSQQQTPPPPVLISQVPIAPPQPPQLPSLPAPNAPPSAPSQQNSSVQFPAQVPQSQVPSISSLSSEPYFPQLAQSTDTAHQHNQTPARQPQQLPQALHYQPLPQMPQFSQSTQPPHPVHPSLQFQPTLPHHPEEEAPYLPPPQTYTTNIRLAVPPTQAPSVPPPPQQYYGPNPSMYEPPLNRPVSRHGSFSASYDPASGPSFSDPYPNSGSPSRYRNSIKSSPFSSSASSSGGSNYPVLPTAQILPQALPTGSSSGSTNGNRVPIDDVVDKVSTMGFSREQVRATVRKLTENGQSVDLNVVLDKLMNGGEIQPQKGWFGR